MNWKQLLSTKRHRDARYSSPQREQADLRSEFEKDYHRIIGSASFRRLQDKTQVFPLDKSDFIRTRLTHSLEVSSFAKSLGQNIGEQILADRLDPEFTPGMKEDICHILQCAGLIHDIGNPPFGHFGEIAIREWFMRNLPALTYHGEILEEFLDSRMCQDFYHFEGNAQALRLVSKLHFLVDEHGMNLTYALLGSILKYPVSAEEMDPDSEDISRKKMGYYLADREIFEEIQRETGTKGRRHPLSFILEAADDIAYKTADIEDAYVKGFVSYNRLLRELREMEAEMDDTGKEALHPARRLETYYRRGEEKGVPDPEEYAVKNWIVRMQSFLIGCASGGFISHYGAIMEGTYKKDLFAGTGAEKLMELLGDLADRAVFTSEAIFRMEVTEAAILEYLMDRFVSAAIKYDDPAAELDSIETRMIHFISGNYKSTYHHEARGKGEKERLYLRLLLATDYICGMTDSYAKRLYQELKAMI